jgi:hypothetical protein
MPAAESLHKIRDYPRGGVKYRAMPVNREPRLWEVRAAADTGKPLARRT